MTSRDFKLTTTHDHGWGWRVFAPTGTDPVGQIFVNVDHARNTTYTAKLGYRKPGTGTVIGTYPSKAAALDAIAAKCTR